MEELQKERKNQMWCAAMKNEAAKLTDKPLEELQKDGVKALLCHHRVEKSALSKKTLSR